MDQKIDFIYSPLHYTKTENENCDSFQIFPLFVTKYSSKHSPCHQDSKSVFKVDIDRWEVGFYSGITDGQTNEWTDRFYYGKTENENCNRF